MRKKGMGLVALRSGIAAAGLLTTVAISAEAEPLKDPYGQYAASRTTWNSIYAGVQGGYSWGDTKSDAIWGPAGAAENFSYNSEGLVGGFHVGISRRFQNIVVGFETDFELSDYNGTGDGNVNAIHATDIDWTGSLRGRIGISEDNTLIYLTGGLAYAHIETSQTQLVPVGAMPFTREKEVRAGWTIGGGIERVISSQVTARLEYRYTDFGRASYFDPNMNMEDTNRLDMHSVRLGLSVHF